MFANMLRPSRRHVHERISQNDDGTNDVGGDDNNNAVDEQQQEQSGNGPSIVILENDLNLVEEGSSDNVNGEAPSTSHHSASVVDASSHSDANNNNASSSSPSSETNNNASSHLQPRSSSGAADTDDTTDDDDDDDEEQEEGTFQPNPTTHPFLTSQIQTERELRYRRQSTCTLLVLFFLVRLWFEAIYSKDVGLIFLSMIGTTWTYRWIMSRREADEEYDRQIMEERNNTNATNGVNNGLSTEGSRNGADAAVNFDPDLGLMSFQAQLALAILESQRQMFENGGYGGNDRNNAHDGPGVTDEAKGKWKSYDWGECEVTTAQLTGIMSRTSSSTDIKRTGSGSNYGSVNMETIDLVGDEDDSLEKPSSVSKLEEGGLLSFDEDEEPSCSICLCEYERGEKVTRLPCDHIYHESCLNSWTENHVRCPLCNYDLMSGFEQPENVRRQQQHAEEQRAFRNMALSTLGRRIRTTRRRSRRAGGAASNRVSTAAALVAAAEDSIV